MLSIRLLSIGAEDYYLNLAAEDYYLQGGEPTGNWTGAAATALALSGPVDPEHFRSLFRGFHPQTGEPLVQNAGRPNRQAAWDHTFSAPKSLSVLWSQAPPDIRHRIQEIQQRAVCATMEFAETTFGYSRTGTRGAELVPARLIAATFEHGTSRTADPQLHTHCVVLNLGIAEDGKTRSIISRPFFRNKMLLGALYRAHLAHRLQAELGLAIERRGNLFEVSGVPADLARHHSKRRVEILRKLTEKGFTGGRAAAIAALETRRSKKDVPPRSELFQVWQEVNAEFGFTEGSVQNLLQQATPVTQPEKALKAAVAAAVENLTRQKTHFSAADLLTETLCDATGQGLSPAAVPAAVQAHLRDDPDCLPIPTKDGGLRYTTTAVLREEERLLTALSKLSQREGLTVSKKTVDTLLANRPTIRSDQAHAVRHLTQAKGAVRIVRGIAGTGKTFMLKTAAEGWHKDGFRVIGAAPTGKAAEVLRQETGIDADTITMRLGDFTIPAKGQLKHHAKQLARAAKKKKTYAFKQPQPVQIDSKTILVVDEAGMVNTRHMKMLLELVEKGGGTIVLIGDPYQLPPVEGGAPFRSISERVGFAELTEIIRQQDAWAREAVQLFARGEVGKALSMYVEKKLVRVRDTKEQALKQLVLDWTAVGLTTPERGAVIAATNEDSEAANRLCQQQRIKAGCLKDSPYVEIIDEDKERGFRFTNRVYVGDRVIFTRNSRKYNVQNGALGTVVAVSKLHQTITVKLDNGKTTIVPVNAFPHIRLGYAMTAYKAQGETFKECYVLLGGPSQDLPTSYVEASRSKLATRFYAEASALDEYLEEVEESPLAIQMARRPDLFLAADLYQHHAQIESNRNTLTEKLLAHWSLIAPGSDPRETAIITETEKEAEELNQRCLQLLRGMAQTDFAKQAMEAFGMAETNREQQKPDQEPKEKLPPSAETPDIISPTPSSDVAQSETQQLPVSETLELGPITYAPGDRIRFEEGSLALGVKPGDLATIESVSQAEATITAKLDYGRTVTIFLLHYRAISHAWALSQSEARGLKLKNALVLQQPHVPEPTVTPTDYFGWRPSPSYQAPYTPAAQAQSFATPSRNTWAAEQTAYYTQLQCGAAQTQWTQKIQEVNQQSFSQTQNIDLNQAITQRYRIAQTWY